MVDDSIVATVESPPVNKVAKKSIPVVSDRALRRREPVGVKRTRRTGHITECSECRACYPIYSKDPGWLCENCSRKKPRKNRDFVKGEAVWVGKIIDGEGKWPAVILDAHRGKKWKITYFHGKE